MTTFHIHSISKFIQEEESILPPTVSAIAAPTAAASPAAAAATADVEGVDTTHLDQTRIAIHSDQPQPVANPSVASINNVSDFGSLFLLIIHFYFTSRLLLSDKLLLWYLFGMETLRTSILIVHERIISISISCRISLRRSYAGVATFTHIESSQQCIQ